MEDKDKSKYIVAKKKDIIISIENESFIRFKELRLPYATQRKLRDVCEEIDNVVSRYIQDRNQIFLETGVKEPTNSNNIIATKDTQKLMRELDNEDVIIPLLNKISWDEVKQDYSFLRQSDLSLEWLIDFPE